MSPNEFIAKWKAGGDERRDAQPFFEDLCRLVGHGTPRELDPEHTWFTYEYGAAKTSGGDGWADVFKRGYFGWEAKGTHRNLDRAYEQLKMYADALDNPPLLVVSDLHSVIIHTNFTNTVKRTISFTIDQLVDFDTMQVLHAVFNNPEALRPGVTREAITQEAAEKFSALAQILRGRGHEPQAVAHFLNRLLFAMFAEDIGLLPNQLFIKLVRSSVNAPDVFEKRCRDLFAAMGKGGDVAFENVEWFNGGLFDDDTVLRLETDDLKILLAACVLDWSSIEPSIFGTMFERGLDPGKRSQLGAHYTDPATIMKIVRPVVIELWLAEWESEKVELAKLLGRAHRTVSKPAQARFNQFLERLRAFTVLDPACGSGNFLYLALRALKDIEKRVLIEGEALGFARQFPGVGPRSVKGIEVNGYAAELARVTIWIGEIQWQVQNGFGARKNPILQTLDQIEHRDALLNPDQSRSTWPPADVVIGNPPFLGNKKLLRELGEDYTTALRSAYLGRVSGGADLVCYWFEKANAAIQEGKLLRAGLVATNSIRGGPNREVIDEIVDSSRIFEAWADEQWINDGAAVRVSMICFGGSRSATSLDGREVQAISPDLMEFSDFRVDLTKARRLAANAGQCFQGVKFGGPFQVSGSAARDWLTHPNPNGHGNSDVMRRWCNGEDLARRPSDSWVIDFGSQLSEKQASEYELPFEYLVAALTDKSSSRRETSTLKTWWRFQRPRPEMRLALTGLDFWIGTPEVSKHRIFCRMEAAILPSGSVYAIASSSIAVLGVLQSRIHELWSLRMGSSLEDRPRYTPTTCFETYPFPDCIGPHLSKQDNDADPRASAVTASATSLLEARDRWLNPPEWAVSIPEVVDGFPDRIVARRGHEAQLKQRTLTNLYNARPAWLADLHHALDTAVAAAYGWEWPLSDDEILRRLFELNQLRSA